VLGLIGRDAQFEIAEAVAREDPAAVFELAGRIVEAGFDLRIVCRELARLVRDLMVVNIDPTRLDDREIVAEGERDRVKALAGQYSREDLVRAFDLLSAAEFEVRRSSQPRHQFEMALVKWIQLRKLTPLSELIADLDRQAPRAREEVRSTKYEVRSTDAKLHAADAKPHAAAAKPHAPDPKPQAADPKPQAPTPKPQVGTDLKSALLSSIREHNKTFYGMVIAQAQKVEVERDAVVFTFAPIHKTLRAQLEGKKAWLEQLAQAATGRRVAVVIRESQPAPAPAGEDPAAARKADLAARARAEPAVQAVLDVFGGEIEDVEEIT
jgi:DNA polymerase-3 subunit gamma/tau